MKRRRRKRKRLFTDEPLGVCRLGINLGEIAEDFRQVCEVFGFGLSEGIQILCEVEVRLHSEGRGVLRTVAENLDKAKEKE